MLNKVVLNSLKLLVICSYVQRFCETIDLIDVIYNVYYNCTLTSPLLYRSATTHSSTSHRNNVTFSWYQISEGEGGGAYILVFGIASKLPLSTDVVTIGVLNRLPIYFDSCICDIFNPDVTLLRCN